MIRVETDDRLLANQPVLVDRSSLNSRHDTVAMKQSLSSASHRLDRTGGAIGLASVCLDKQTDGNLQFPSPIVYLKVGCMFTFL